MLRVAILSSYRAPGVESVLQHPERGRLFEIVCVIATHPDFAQSDLLSARGVPVISHPIRWVAGRAEYDRITAQMLRHLHIDVVVLLGYLYILTEPMLSAFPERIVNIHDGDLTIRGRDGERRYVGLHSTLDAIRAGERSTRSSVHLVTEKVDGGPILMLSESYEVPGAAAEALTRGDVKALKRIAWRQRETMMRGWGSLALRALQMVAGRPQDAEIEEVAV
jgi:phosphoribosylglycinamide formyltransferase-1